MEFDKGSDNKLETDYMAIQMKFTEHGYRNVPEIVFWKLRDSSATPVMAAQNGVVWLVDFPRIC